MVVKFSSIFRHGLWLRVHPVQEQRPLSTRMATQRELLKKSNNYYSGDPIVFTDHFKTSHGYIPGRFSVVQIYPIIGHRCNELPGIRNNGR